ncbi:MAG: MarR family transcriptional regulator [Sporichthyaceae bacterium]
MDSAWSAAAVARELGTNVPRVVRAVDRLRLGGGRATGARRLSTADVQRLRAELGVTVAVPGLRRVHVQTLAALARAPLGARSIRRLARAAGLSPTAVGRAADDLLALGLVERETYVEGRARIGAVLRVGVCHPRWPQLAPVIADVRLPGTEAESDGGVPPRLAHVFWNADLAGLDVHRDGGYLARRVLTDGDTAALAWAARTLAPEHWRAAARTRGLDERHRALARNLAAVPP